MYSDLPAALKAELAVDLRLRRGGRRAGAEAWRPGLRNREASTT